MLSAPLRSRSLSGYPPFTVEERGEVEGPFASYFYELAYIAQCSWVVLQEIFVAYHSAQVFGTWRTVSSARNVLNVLKRGGSTEP